MHEKVRMLQQALLDQRRILAENIDRPVETVPQAFTPYKEVLEIYSNGLELPDDITIVWPDDNYGYMKRLSGVREQRRTGALRGLLPCLLPGRTAQLPLVQHDAPVADVRGAAQGL